MVTLVRLTLICSLALVLAMPMALTQQANAKDNNPAVVDQTIDTVTKPPTANNQKIVPLIIIGLALFSAAGFAGWLWSWRRQQAERLRNRARLEENFRQLETAAKIGQLGYWRYYPSTETFFFSDELFDLFPLGHLNNPISLEQTMPLIHPADREDTIAVLDRATKSVEPVAYEFRIFTETGEKRYVAGESRIEHGSETGEITVFGIFQDVTDRKKSEVALRKSEQQFRSILDDSLQGNMIHRDGKLVYANQALIDILAYDDAADIYSVGSIFDFIAPEDLVRLASYKELRQRGDDPPSSYEARFLRKDGGEVWADVLVRTIIWDGKPTVQAIVSDTTERRAMEEARRQSQKMSAIGQLTGGVAHDFNNLLAVIIGNLDMVRILLDDFDSKNIKDIGVLVERALKSANKGAGLTDQLLAFTRKQNLEPKVTRAETIFPELQDMLFRTLPDNISLNFQVHSETSDFRAEANQLTNALINLAVNARDAMPDGGRLDILAANSDDSEISKTLPQDVTPGNFVEIRVTDSGVGMKPEVVEQAFEPFFTTKDVGAGTGLGLSMVFGFTRQSGGFATINSEPGVGTTVSLYLPVADTAGTTASKP